MSDTNVYVAMPKNGCDAMPQEVVLLLTIPHAIWKDMLGPHPRRRVLYAVSCILGIRGRLLTGEGPAGDEIEYDDAGSGVFTYYPEGMPKAISNVNLDDQRSTTTESSQRGRQKTLRNKVIERDGCCIVTRSRAFTALDAGHLLPNSKGDLYIEALSIYRGNPAEHITSIADTRVAVTLKSDAHRIFGAQEAGLLPDPNWATSYPNKASVPRQVLWQQYEVVDIRDLINNHPCHLELCQDGAPPVWLLEVAFGAYFLSRFGTPEGLERMTMDQSKVIGMEVPKSSRSSKRPSSAGEKEEHRESKRAFTSGKEAGNNETKDRSLGHANALDAILSHAALQRRTRMDSGYRAACTDEEEEKESAEKVQSWLETQRTQTDIVAESSDT